MMLDELMAVAVLETDGELSIYHEGQKASEAVEGLLECLAVKEDRELGIEEVRPQVVVDGLGRVFNILLNGKSIGFYAIKTLVNEFQSLSLPPVVYCGRDNFDLQKMCEEHDYKLCIIPLFGEIEDA